MMSLLAVEFAKLFKRKSTYFGYAALLANLSLILWAMARFKREMTGGMVQSQGIDAVGSPATATFFAYWAMFAASWLVILFSVYVAGNTVAGEWASGTLRTTLCRPVSRAKLIIAKWVVASCYSLSLTVFLVVASLLAGWAVLGFGDLVIPPMGPGQSSQKIIILPWDMALVRFTLALGMQFLWLEALMGLALLASVVMKSGPVAIITVLGTLVSMAVLSVMPFEFFETLKPYFITSYYLGWQQGFRVSPDWVALIQDYWYTVVYAALSITLAFSIFTARDISA